LLRKARGILNKLCPQKFDILVEKFNELQIDTEEKLRVCMELVFEKVNILGFDLTEFFKDSFLQFSFKMMIF